jgi:hypothetical protein
MACNYTKHFGIYSKFSVTKTGLTCLAANEVEDPTIQFDMGSWAEVLCNDGASCGTAACLVGTYILKDKPPTLMLVWDDGSAEIQKPNWDECRSSRILADHFDVTEDEAIYLFTPWSYGAKDRNPLTAEVTREVATARLREFILKNETAALQT